MTARQMSGPALVRWMGSALAGLILAAALAGCNWQRDDQGGQPPAGGDNPAAGGEVEGAPSQPAAVETGGAAGGSLAGSATPEAGSLEAELDQALEELDDLNSAADTLEDEP